ncbi:MAG TPA: hypothetical protein VK153_01495 [Candidatus Paceibacterota bacterium]|nr:hypothetical protein [Candidatus Paceibacterota bacterium]
MRKVKKCLPDECGEKKFVFIFLKQNNVDLTKAHGLVIEKVIFDLGILNYESRIIAKVKRYIVENNNGLDPVFLIVNPDKDHRFGFTSIRSIKEVSSHKSEKATQTMSA